MEIRERVPMQPFTTFRMGGPVSYFAELNVKTDIADFARFAEEKSLPFMILGGGSNVIFPDTGEFAACVGKIALKGFEIVSQSDTEAIVKIGAGEIWDGVIERIVSLGLSGIEALSAIPGTAGATPVQNVGAYGQEISQTLVELEAFDLKEKRAVRFSNAECGFSYRNSKFKNEWKGRYVIVSITLKLSRMLPAMPNYPGVAAYFERTGISNPSLENIRNAIIEIRKYKLPDPKVIASCGSFFKNPIISGADAARIKERYPDAVQFVLDDGRIKLAAGWMLEKLGFKGAHMGRIGVYEHNALVLVNLGGATQKELSGAVSRIQAEVSRAFGVDLEPEVVRFA
jgi:UDP-N-acetylmuramate dehydrogenase